MMAHYLVALQKYVVLCLCILACGKSANRQMIERTEALVNHDTNEGNWINTHRLVSPGHF